MNRKASLITFASLLAILLCTANAGAGILYTNFGPNYAYDNNWNGQHAWLIGVLGGANQVVAMPFTPSTTADAYDALLAVGWDGSGTNVPMNVYLANDSLGLPGGLIDTMIQVGDLPNGPAGGGVVTFNSTLFPLLTAGTQYWLIAQQPTAFDGWFWTYNDALGNFADNQTGNPLGPWTADNGYQLSAFEVDAAVPEPGTLLMMASGAIGLAGLLRRKVMA